MSNHVISILTNKNNCQFMSVIGRYRCIEDKDAPNPADLPVLSCRQL